MARVTVFVDDAVRGELPMVCVRDGAPATRMARLEQSVGSASPVWFVLLFLGPLGWIVLALVSSSVREQLTVRVPVCEATVTDWERRRRARIVAVLGVGAAVLTGVLTGWGTLGAMLVAVAVVAMFVTHWRLQWSAIDVDLDASRRWVTLKGVDPAFAAAVDARREQVR